MRVVFRFGSQPEFPKIWEYILFYYCISKRDIFFCLFVCFSLCLGCVIPQWATASSFTRFPDHTQRSNSVGRTPLDEWSARRRDLYLSTHNTHNRQTFMSPVGFEPTISRGERPQTYALERVSTGTGEHGCISIYLLEYIIPQITWLF
jgi:hypothetical protein